ncbi:MAG: GNAT family N-acetyltransferase [Clostridium sp.]|nr:GNAT family N-acetyltransferase [Clostridium sp.]
MRIRPYIETRDYESIEKWIDNERTHALWCANLMPYPLTRQNLHDFLEKGAVEWADSAYVATDDSGKAVGFFIYSVNTNDNAGFLKCIIIDNQMRGAGYGRQMLQLALRYAFHITGAALVRLNVFEVNAAAKSCYEKAGFTMEGISKDVFPYKNELWSRCHMISYRQPQ